MLADFLLGFGALLLIGAGLWYGSRWFGDTVRKAIDRSVRADFWGGA